VAKGQDWIEQAAFEIAASSDSSTTAEIAAIIQKHCPREIDVEVQVARPADTPTPPKCRTCGAFAEYHCDFDEPGLDHAADCAMYHHEFKPAAPLPPAVAPAQTQTESDHRPSAMQAATFDGVKPDASQSLQPSGDEPGRIPSAPAVAPVELVPAKPGHRIVGTH
jgi:hypothetical protein